MQKTLFFLLLLLSTSVLAQGNAATLISDFDIEGIENWWTYSDDLGTSFVAELDNAIVYDGENSLRMDFNIVSSGYAGIGFDYGTRYDWTAGEGIILQIRASSVGIPFSVVLHLADESQTSELSPGVTPFAVRLETPEGSDSDWVEMTLLWEDFERLWWVGEAGISEFTAQSVTGVEIAYEGFEDAGFEGSIWIDNIRVISEIDLNQPPSFEEQIGAIPSIRANQLGYRPNDSKIFVSNQPFETFNIINIDSSEIVFTGNAEYWGFDADSQEEVYWGVFDDLQTLGNYQIVIEGLGESYPFEISDTPYTEALYLGTRALYLQRSGILIDDTTISGLNLEAGHLEPALFWDEPNAEAIDVSGGWYDAGDFGRYIPTGAFAVNQLLLAYHINPTAFPDGFLDIPESGNGVSDLLDEIRWELDWMLRMQSADGSVHHKVTTRSFPAFGTLPAEDTEQLYVFGVSSGDTAYFAAVMAQASKIYTEIDPEFAANCLDAAQSAWAWLEQHPEQFPAGGFQNPPVSEYPMQGGYDFVGDETVPRMWAAAELFKSTGEIKYEDAFAGFFTGFDGGHTMSWANAYPMALYAYLTSENADRSLWNQVANIFQTQAAEIYEVTEQSAYGVALNDNIAGFEYQWGSNQIALAHGLYLLMADEIFPESQYDIAAEAQLHYLFGLNPLARAYFGGLGENPILQPHHNVSYHFGISVPGFVGEGANSQNAGGDAVLIALQEAGAPPAMSYIDHWDSWASNEPTIDANATFVALLAYILHE